MFDMPPPRVITGSAGQRRVVELAVLEEKVETRRKSIRKLDRNGRKRKFHG